MMQNNKMNKIRQLMKAKGYYIVLFLCLIAVGTSGYLYYRNRDSKPTKKTNDSPSIRMEEKTVVPTKEAQSEPAVTSKAQDVLSEDTIDKENLVQAKPDTAMPVEGDAIAEYATDHLAYNETTRDWRTHSGIDIASELGEQVHAAADGLVSAVYDDAELGKTVVIEHKGGYQTYYANLAPDVQVSVGQRVTKGAVLGAVGDSAICEVAQKPHLHFAVCQGSDFIDPKDFFTP